MIRVLEWGDVARETGGKDGRHVPLQIPVLNTCQGDSLSKHFLGGVVGLLFFFLPCTPPVLRDCVARWTASC